MSDGTSSAYFGTCVSGFPNFFIMMGPNTLSGHLSVIYTTECQINFTMRVIKPVMKAIAASRSVLPTIRNVYDIVDIKPDAEQKDIDTVQEKAKQLVWATGCTSWFIEPNTKRNTIMYPDYQYKYWLRSVWIAWSDFTYKTSEDTTLAKKRKGSGAGVILPVVLSTVAAAGAMFFGRRG